MRIFLIGYMGCGKSTIGRRLAASMNLSFVDLDTFIESRNFRSIPEIFEKEGEDGFRELEHKALVELSDYEDVVVATGGGAPCFFNNMEIIKNSGVSVYLNGTPRVLAERLLKSRTERPLIKGKSEPELIAFIDESLTKRSKWYNQADIIIDFDSNLYAEDVADEIIRYNNHKTENYHVE